MKKTILIADDDKNVRLSLSFLLEDAAYIPIEANCAAEVLSTLNEEPIDVLLLDLNYSKDTTSGEEGLSLLKTIRARFPKLPVIVMTGWASLDVVVEAMKTGAQDFIEKPWDNHRLLQIVRQQLEFAQLKLKNQFLSGTGPALPQQFCWQSPVMLSLFTQAQRIASSDAAVLLTGENGTGKSSLAAYIHQASNRREEPMITINMGAIPADLFESEMFGHKKGAFTGASEHRTGRFELAHRSTLFLDELSTIPLAQQAKLLRVLETGEFEAVGSSTTQKTDVRLISASNSNFSDLIKQQSFREDLYYRLNTIILHVPALRERTEDIVPLAHFFLHQHCQKYHRPGLTLSPQAQLSIQHYPWPGNVRELSHVIERAVLLTLEDVISHQQLNLHHVSAGIDTSEGFPTLDDAEYQLIKKALVESCHNVKSAATLLGITPSALYRRLEKFNLHA